MESTKETSTARNLIALILVLFFLKIADFVLIPFVIAVFLFIIMEIISAKYKKFLFGDKNFWWSVTFSKILSIITMIGLVYFIVIGIESNISQVVHKFSGYQPYFNNLIEKARIWLGITHKITMNTIFQEFNLTGKITNFAGWFAGFFSMFLMVIVYLVFLMLEKKYFYKKIYLFFDDTSTVKVKNILKKITSKLEIYMAVKMTTSFLTGICSYFVMKFFDLDFALFWAILMFLFNFIPTIGSVVSSVFPIIFAFLQFGGKSLPFIILAISIILIQLFIGNVVDPKMMGKKLNLSPLVIILSLAVWGAIWGIAGMFLSIPIMIVLTIVLLQIPGTKKLSLLLTSDGEEF